MNPDGAEYPSGLWVNRSQVYEVHLKSDLKPSYLSVQYPMAGDWFMVAFISESSNKIQQAVSFRTVRHEYTYASNCFVFTFPGLPYQ